MEKYSLVVQWSEEDRGYIATIPEFDGLSAFGITKEEAFRELEVAKKAYLEVFREDGCPLPKPDTLNSFSGQIRLRMPKSLHALLSRKAKAEGVSLNAYLNYLLSERNIEHRIDKKLDYLEEGMQNLTNQQQVIFYTRSELYPSDTITVTSSGQNIQMAESLDYDSNVLKEEWVH